MNSEEIDFFNAEVLRTKAEELLISIQESDLISEEVTDLKKLLHELQVHKIELEMQNEELRQAYERAETTLRKYTMLFDLSSSGFFTLDSDGAICDLNFTGADLLGERRFSLLDSNFKLFVAKDSKAVFNDFFRRAYISNSKETCEVVLGYNKVANPVYIEGIVTEDDQKFFLSIIDISKFNLKNK